MPNFLHLYRDHRKSLTVMEDIIHGTNFEKKKGLVNWVPDHST